MSAKPTGGAPAPKRQKTDEPNEEPDMSPEEKKLEELQDQLDQLDKEAAEEIIAVQKKYNSKKKPIYEDRAKVVKNIPDFWSKAATNHPILGTILTEKDEEVFKFLDSINVEDFEDIKLGFRIELRFRPNAFFKNSALTKEFRFTEDGEFESVQPSKIDWKEGKDLTVQNVDDEEHQESFFSFWFDPANQDIEVAEMFKDVFASPAKYYHNLVPSPEDDGSDEGDDDEESGDDNDDE